MFKQVAGEYVDCISLGGESIDGVERFEIDFDSLAATDSDVAMIIGNNTLVSHFSIPGGVPSFSPSNALREGLKRGMKVICIDPRRSDIAKKSSLHLQVKPGQDAIFKSFLNTLPHRGDVLPGNGAANDLIYKLEPSARRKRHDLQLHIAKLPPATGLPDKTRPGGSFFPEGFTVGHLGFTHIRAHAELPRQTIDQNLEVKLPHPLEDGLVRFLVRSNPEGWVFIRKPGERSTELVMIRFCRGLDCD